MVIKRIFLSAVCAGSLLTFSPAIKADSSTSMLESGTRLGFYAVAAYCIYDYFFNNTQQQLRQIEERLGSLEETTEETLEHARVIRRDTEDIREFFGIERREEPQQEDQAQQTFWGRLSDTLGSWLNFGR